MSPFGERPSLKDAMGRAGVTSATPGGALRRARIRPVLGGLNLWHPPIRPRLTSSGSLAAPVRAVRVSASREWTLVAAHPPHQRASGEHLEQDAATAPAYPRPTSLVDVHRTPCTGSIATVATPWPTARVGDRRARSALVLLHCECLTVQVGQREPGCRPTSPALEGRGSVYVQGVTRCPAI